VQAILDAPRQDLAAGDVEALIESESIEVVAGLELVDAAGDPVNGGDLSDRLVSDQSAVERNNFAEIHGSCRLRIQGAIDWGAARVRPFMTILDEETGVEARFDLGVYLLDTPVRVIGSSPEEFDVEGYDLLAILDAPVGATYTTDAAVNVVAEVESILDAVGAGTPHLIASSDAVTATARTWPLDETTTWLRIVNDHLLSIGHRGLWADWHGRYRSEPQVSPADRDPEWTYDADSVTTIVGDDRAVTAEFHNAPNRWVGYIDNPAVGIAEPSTSGVYERVNEFDGPTSIEGRGGRTITKVKRLEAVDDDALAAQVDAIVDQDLRPDLGIEFKAGPNPLHWHLDVVGYRDVAVGPPLKAPVHKWQLPLDGSDMAVALHRAMDLLDDILATAGPPADSTRTYGKVTDDSPLAVQFNGTDPADAVTGVLKLDHYTPVVGDLVQLDKVGSSWVVQGKIG